MRDDPNAVIMPTGLTESEALAWLRDHYGDSVTTQFPLFTSLMTEKLTWHQ